MRLTKRLLGTLALLLAAALLLGCASASPSPTAEPAAEPTAEPTAEPADATEATDSPEKIALLREGVHEAIEVIAEGFPDMADQEWVTSPVTIGDIPLQDNGNEAFGGQDMTAGGLALGATQDEALAELGAPVMANIYEMAASGDRYLYWTYPNNASAEFVLTDEGYAMESIAVTAPGIAGPRGIEVGDTAQAVLDAFRVDLPDADKREPSAGSYLFYADGFYQGGDGVWYPYGSYGFVSLNVGLYAGESEEGAYTIIYQCADVSLDGMTEEEIAENTPYMGAYACIFSIRDDKVSAYSWGYLPGAE